MQLLYRFPIVALVACLTVPTTASAQSSAQSSAQADTENSEDDVEQGIQLGERVTLFTSLELEWAADRLRFADSADRESSSEQSHALDVGAEIDLSDAFAAFINLNIDLSEDQIEFDEYGIAWGNDDLDVSAGLQSLPVLELESAFISDPLTSFNEITGKSVAVHYAANERLEFSVGAYTGGGEDVPDRGNGTDWTATLDFSASEALSFQIGYQSDIGDADFNLAEDADSGRVPAVSVGARFSHEDWEIAALVVKATRAIPGADSALDRPSASALQLRWTPLDKLELALRADRSRELSEEPARRVGIGVTWFFHPNAALALEYSSQRFDAGLADADEPFANRSNQWLAQLTFRF